MDYSKYIGNPIEIEHFKFFNYELKNGSYQHPEGEKFGEIQHFNSGWHYCENEHIEGGGVVVVQKKELKTFDDLKDIYLKAHYLKLE